MAYVTRIEGPYGDKFSYKAYMSDGTEITFGPTTDPRYPNPHPLSDRTAVHWYVSIGGSRDHSSFIIKTYEGMLEGPGEWVIKQIKARGADKEYWRAYAVAILGSG